MTTTMRTALVKTDVNCHKVVRYDDYKSQKEFAADLRGNGYKVLKIWNGDISDAEVEEWHFLHRDYDKCNTENKAENSAEEIYIAHTYIFRNGALRHREKEFSTPTAAYNYLHKKMMNYAGTTDATQTIELWNGKKSTEIYSNRTGGEEKTSNAEIQTLIDKYDAEIDARIAAADSNAELIACIDDYSVDVDAAAEVEIENAKNAKAVEENAEVKKFEVGKWYYDCCISAGKSPAYKVTHRTKKMVTLTDDFGEIIKRKIDATSSVEKVSLNGDIMPIFLQADCFCRNAEEIQKAEDNLAYSISQDEKNDVADYAAAEVEEVNARNAVFEISKKRGAFIANVFANCGKFSIKLARSDEDRNFHLDEDGLWTVRLTEKDVGYLNELYYYEEGGKFTLALMRGLTDYNLAEYDTEEEVRKAIISLGVAVKRGEKIFTFPAARKPIIDWDAVYNDFRIEEIFNLQKDFKKFLKLGEMKRAESVFENLKHYFKVA